MSKKMKEPPKRTNHKGNIKFPNPRKPPPVVRSIIHLFIINSQSKPNWRIPSRVILIEKLGPTSYFHAPTTIQMQNQHHSLAELKAVS
jgi:hypothetical protein